MDAGIKPSCLCPSFTSPPEVSLVIILCCIYVLWRTKLHLTSPLPVQGKKQKGVVFVLGQHGNPRMRADSDLLLFIGRSFTSRERATKCVWERVVSSPSDYIMVSSQAELLIQVFLCTLKVLAVFIPSHHDSSKQRSETVTSRETKDTLRWEVSLRIPQMLNIHEALIPSPTPEKREGAGRAHQKSNHLPSLW